MSFLATAIAVLITSSLPNPTLTPGAINPEVTQANIHETICVLGWTRIIRPPEHYTERLKRRQIRQYGYHDLRLRDYEEDHLIPLALGGSPTDPANLWPEPRHAADGWTAEMKDELEVELSRRVCAEEIPLDQARSAIALNWHDAYTRYVTGR